MDLVDLINRYTPPSNPMEYLTEQGYFVLIRDEEGNLIRYEENNKPQNMDDVIILVNNDLMLQAPKNPNINDMMVSDIIDLTKSTDILRCEETIEEPPQIQEIPPNINDMMVSDFIDLTKSTDILRCEETIEEPPQIQEIPPNINDMMDCDIIDLTKSTDILRCEETIEEPPQIQEIPQNRQWKIKFIITSAAESSSYYKECYDYMLLKNKVMWHINANSQEELVVSGTIEDLIAINAEILYHTGQSQTKFLF